MCLSAETTPECSAWICEGCPGLELGHVTVCNEDATDIIGCVFALHPQCGLKCELATVGQCNGVAAPCQEYACGLCPGGAPGVVECQGGRLVTCLGAGTGGDQECAQLCTEVEVGSCE